MSDERSHEFTRGQYGWITHSDLSSTDAAATREWCAEVLGWTFQPPFPTPGGDYHLFAYSDAGGGRHPSDGARRSAGVNPDRARRGHPSGVRRSAGRWSRIG